MGRSVVFTFLCALLLMGCFEKEVIVPEPSFYDRLAANGKVTLAVQKINFDNSYLPSSKLLPTGLVYVEQRAPEQPLFVLNNIFKNRYAAAGGEFTARINIVEASILRVPNPEKRPVPGWSETTNTFRYDLRFDVDIEVLDKRGFIAASTNSVVTRSKEEPVGESAQISLLQAMTEEAAEALDQEMYLAVKRYLEIFVD